MDQFEKMKPIGDMSLTTAQEKAIQEANDNVEAAIETDEPTSAIGKQIKDAFDMTKKQVEMNTAAKKQVEWRAATNAEPEALKDTYTQIEKTKVLTPFSESEVHEMFGGDDADDMPLGIQLPVVEIMKEAAQFKMPDGELTPSFTGHILLLHNVNALFYKKFGDSENEPPVCSSTNGKMPDGGDFPFCKIKLRNGVTSEKYVAIIKKITADIELQRMSVDSMAMQVHLNAWCALNNRTASSALPSDVFDVQPVTYCKECVANRFGTAIHGNKKGKLCSNKIWLYILIDSQRVPVVLKLPPTSLDPGLAKGILPFIVSAKSTAPGGKYQALNVKFTLATKEYGSMSSSVLQLEKSGLVYNSEFLNSHVLPAYKETKNFITSSISQEVAASCND